MSITPDEVVTFWRDAGPAKWFARSDAFDELCRARFHDAHIAASQRAFDEWMAQPESALALLILIDQIPRNIFRNSAHAYACDGLARFYARQALDSGVDKQVDVELRAFMYLPFEHSEMLADQELALTLMQTLPDPASENWARIHYDIIQRFGRFPYRNPVLGRITTPEEQAYLDAGGFAG